LDMVKGYDDGYFRPENTINRAEYYKVLISASGLNLQTPTNDPFRDVPMGEWFTNAVYTALSNKIIDSANYFSPDQAVSRAEVAESLYRLLNK
ncbi:MAG TPA: S-layer homology domain-containing protein, partial [Candidatus Gracilibacteria bacterium]|nr:S-layer homology domain-containing protein [Candidatus Gracilibacteria bacterium]